MLETVRRGRNRATQLQLGPRHDVPGRLTYRGQLAEMSSPGGETSRPIDRIELLGMSTKIGVSVPTKFRAKHRCTFTRLAAHGGFTAERFLERSATALAAPDAAVAGRHVYTFNQTELERRWLGVAALRQSPVDVLAS